MKYSFLPLVNESCKVLILGSLPGELSLEKQQYYAHPQNCFWRMMFEILGEPYSEDYKTKCDMLLRHNIALWDVVCSAEREGSLDVDIKNAVPNDIVGFLNRYSQINKVLLNGGKATSLFKKHFKNVEVKVVSLPSTSPANASMNYAQKKELWGKGF